MTRGGAPKGLLSGECYPAQAGAYSVPRAVSPHSCQPPHPPAPSLVTCCLDTLHRVLELGVLLEQHSTCHLNVGCSHSFNSDSIPAIAYVLQCFIHILCPFWLSNFYWFERQKWGRERDREDLLSTSSLPQTPTTAGTGLKQEPGVLSNLSHGWHNQDLEPSPAVSQGVHP